MLRLMRRLGLGQRQPLVQGALRRRRTWRSSQACYESYRRKNVFASWTEASLRAYVEAGTRLRDDGQVELVYPPEWEAHIFATTPVDVWRYVRHLGEPSLVIRGQHSKTFELSSQRRMVRQLPRVHFRVIPGAGHLVPMERPAETGLAVRTFLEAEYSHP
jgi:pimeloyl-ACP methyl ester carboxylesterase